MGNNCFRKDFFSFPILQIEKIEKKNQKQDLKKWIRLRIQMKNGRIIDLRFLKSLNYNIKSIIAWLKDASLLENKGHCFAFTYFNQLNFGNENTIYSKWPYRSENIVDEFYRQLKSNYIRYI